MIHSAAYWFDFYGFTYRYYDRVDTGCPGV